MIKNGTITGSGEKFVELNNGKCKLDNVKVNNVTRYLIFATSGNNKEIEINDSTFTHNHNTGDDRTIYLNADNNTENKVSITNSTFADNGAEGKECFFWINNATTKITSSRFENNSGNYGGTFRQNSRKLDISNTTFKNNTVNQRGGALYLGAGTDTTLGSETTFESNKNTAESGGAIYLDSADQQETKLMLDGPAFEKNEAKQYGGAITIDQKTKLDINGGTFSENSAKKEGGALYSAGEAKVKITKGTFTKNKASIDGWAVGGGAIISKNTAFTFNGATVDNNIASRHESGGITISVGRVEFKKGVITNNKTGYLEDGTTANDKYADWGGGGIFITDQGTQALFPDTTLITDNKLGGFGGGLARCSTGRNFIFNTDTSGTVIFDNSADGKRTSGEGSAKDADRTYAANNKVFMNHDYQDCYCTLMTVISKKMIGGKNEMWEGSIDGEVYDASKYPNEVTSAYAAGLTSQASKEDKDTIRGLGVSLKIQNNASASHGGGMLNNGIAVFGSSEGKELVFPTSADLNANVKLVDEASNEKSTDKGWTYQVKDSQGKVGATGVSDTDDTTGKINFDKRLYNNDDVIKEALDNRTAMTEENDKKWTFTYTLSQKRAKRKLLIMIKRPIRLL